jgi:hypothetical protein
LNRWNGATSQLEAATSAQEEPLGTAKSPGPLDVHRAIGCCLHSESGRNQRFLRGGITNPGEIPGTGGCGPTYHAVRAGWAGHRKRQAGRPVPDSVELPVAGNRVHLQTVIIRPSLPPNLSLTLFSTCAFSLPEIDPAGRKSRWGRSTPPDCPTPELWERMPWRQPIGESFFHLGPQGIAKTVAARVQIGDVAKDRVRTPCWQSGRGSPRLGLLAFHKRRGAFPIGDIALRWGNGTVQR